MHGSPKSVCEHPTHLVVLLLALVMAVGDGAESVGAGGAGVEGATVSMAGS